MSQSVGPLHRPDLERSLALAKASYAAYVDKDRAALDKILAVDFHFTSPLDNRLDRETYFARCWPNSDKLRDFEFIRLASPDGETVLLASRRMWMAGDFATPK